MFDSDRTWERIWLWNAMFRIHGKILVLNKFQVSFILVPVRNVCLLNSKFCEAIEYHFWWLRIPVGSDQKINTSDREKKKKKIERENKWRNYFFFWQHLKKMNRIMWIQRDKDIRKEKREGGERERGKKKEIEREKKRGIMKKRLQENNKIENNSREKDFMLKFTHFKSHSW